MVSKIFSAAVIGLNAALIEVEAGVNNGLPFTIIVGLPDAAILESKERVKAAIRHSECNYPYSRVSVNLAPADVPKLGTHFDLPIALAILLASEQVRFNPAGKLFLGELSLDGSLRGVPGVLAVTLRAKELGFLEIYVPAANAAEAALVNGIVIYSVNNLTELIQHLNGDPKLNAVVATQAGVMLKNISPGLDMKDIAGQESAKRALLISASGSHNILLNGPPGSGKTLLARALSGILPDLRMEESLELTKIYSIAGKLNSSLITTRPVRHPHHTSSSTALVGGGAIPRPGEITLAHRGILFLDEFPEFPRSVLESLRQPLEDGVVTISRVSGTFTFPAKFTLVAAQNPCPCGYLGDEAKRCSCPASQILKYQKKISGPLLDRIDLHIDVPRLPFEKMQDYGQGESSADMKNKVEKAREIQVRRFGSPRTNSEMGLQEIQRFCVLGLPEQQLVKQAMARYNFSGRSFHRILKLARTIADLDGQPNITVTHIAEALQYRPKTD